MTFLDSGFAAASQAAVLLAAATCVTGCGPRHVQALARKVIVLGVDGMDPNFVEQHWDVLPNFDRLRREGGFSRLQTTTPPQSPVAWSTFITGMDPAAHGIFDFVHRDPATLLPHSSMSETDEPKLSLSIGPYTLPLSRARVRSLRKGRAFWELLADRHIPVTIIHMPVNYPPVDAGQELAGMGTPDLRGTMGTFTFYTDDPAEISRSVSGGQIVKVPGFANRVLLKLEGPPNSLRKKHPFSSVDMTVDIDPRRPIARLAVGDSTAVIRQGEWSDWIEAEFPLLGSLAQARGMFRVFARQLHPAFEMYVSPVNLDPRASELPISVPAAYSRDIAGEIGPYYTQGIAEDTSALRQFVLNRHQFLEQSSLVLHDELRLLRYSLGHFGGGLLFFYFSSIDQNSHILWGRYDTDLLPFYRAVDTAIGEVMKQEPDADLIVLSDHGFTTFDRAVNLNTWLWKEGFLTLRGAPGDDELFANVDWSETEMYALGLNGLYLNLEGREKNGIVKRGIERQAILSKVTGQLLSFRDPENGRQVVESVYAMPSRLGISPVAPDLIVGYGRGYRTSWQTALGATPPDVIENNTDAWIGDHCVNAADVPGVLFSSRKIRSGSPRLKDVTVSILALFETASDAGMTGRMLF